MDFDPHFDKFRLDQLAEQHLSGSTAQGRVIFFSDSEDNRLDYSTWQFEDEGYEALKTSEFKLHLLELLSSLMVYRAQHGQPNSSQGVVTVDKNALTIEWLSKDSAEALREAAHSH